MTKHIRKLPALPLLTAALLLGGAGARTLTGQTLPFPVAQLFFELNNSAGDLGIHPEIDGGPWTGSPSRAPSPILGTEKWPRQGWPTCALRSGQSSLTGRESAWLTTVNPLRVMR